jgi:hypothetical protein
MSDPKDEAFRNAMVHNTVQLLCKLHGTSQRKLLSIETMLTDICAYSRHLFNRSLSWRKCCVVTEYPFTKRENGVVLTGNPYIKAGVCLRRVRCEEHLGELRGVQECRPDRARWLTTMACRVSKSLRCGLDQLRRVKGQNFRPVYRDLSRAI